MEVISVWHPGSRPIGSYHRHPLEYLEENKQQVFSGLHTPLAAAIRRCF
jgi:hypothetical protein